MRQIRAFSVELRVSSLHNRARKMSQSVDEMPAVVQVVVNKLTEKQLFNQNISTINMTSLVDDVQKQNNHKQLK